MGPKDLAADRPNHKLGMFVVTVMVFLGAILLFWMEPLVGRMLTPYFGGAANVWLLCLMFFQAMLLLGYLYAHLLAKKVGPYHLLLLLVPFVNLPLRIHAEFNPYSPLWNVLSTLITYVALPFVVLSTTAVVAQSWLSRSAAGRSYEPYPLYAASNAGALIALIGYTFLVEPFLGLRQLSLAWTGVYIIYAFFVASAWFLLRPAKEYKDHPGETEKSSWQKVIASGKYWRWFVLSALPSAYLLAVTNLITLEIGSFPLTWVFPLALYLASFIVTFRTSGGVPRLLNRLWPEILLCALLCYFLGATYFGLVIFGSLASFFMICCLAHGNLYELRPPENHLTAFYLAIALGGWVGGAFVSLLAPIVFVGLFEYPVLLGLFFIAFYDRQPRSIMAIWPKSSWVFGGVRILLIGILAFLTIKGAWVFARDNVIYRYRNFYGIYRVIDSSILFEGIPTGIRKLAHGMTLHGAQLLDGKNHLTPITYYHKGGAIADVFESIESPRRIAVIGLGSGVTAAFIKKEDSITFYELDPDNLEIAQLCFTFWDECQGKIDLVVGDGRLSLQNKVKGGSLYDLIHVDAFSGDGIPTNLLTREAIEIYLSRLSPKGIILFHVSNRNYELRPVIKSIARDLKLLGARNIPIKKENLKPHQNATKCVVLTRDPDRLEPLFNRGWISLDKNDGFSVMSPWTDEYINLLHPLIENIRLRLAEDGDK
jgi:hypothetical protein